MGLFVNEKSNYKIYVHYVFDKNANVHVVSEEDKKKIEESSAKDGETSNDGYPFNEMVKLKDYKKEDLKQAHFIFRKADFSDMPKMFKNINGQMSVGEAMNFNLERMEQLFVKGLAQDEGGKQHNITHENMGGLDPAIGGYVVLELSDKI